MALASGECQSVFKLVDNEVSMLFSVFQVAPQAKAQPSRPARDTAVFSPVPGPPASGNG